MSILSGERKDAQEVINDILGLLLNPEQEFSSVDEKTPPNTEGLELVFVWP